MSVSIEEARIEVQRSFDCALSAAERADSRTFWAFEAEAWTLLLALGRALAVLFAP